MEKKEKGETLILKWENLDKEFSSHFLLCSLLISRKLSFQYEAFWERNPFKILSQFALICSKKLRNFFNIKTPSWKIKLTKYFQLCKQKLIEVDDVKRQRRSYANIYGILEISIFRLKLR